MADAQPPRGIRGPAEPRAGFRIADLPADRLYSTEQLEAFDHLAERDAWHQARHAFAPGNRPVIRQQLNPLMVPEAYRQLPEFWGVYVPHTLVAWNARQIIYDYTQRIDPQWLAETTATDEPTPAERRRIAASRSQADLEDRLRHRQGAVFGSADEAERFAQETWRAYWQQHFTRQYQVSQARFADDAVITVIRQRVFTVDWQNPAHVLQYERWSAEHPDGLPTDVIVHHRHAPLLSAATLAVTPRPSTDPTDEDFEATEWKRMTWIPRRPQGLPVTPSERWLAFPVDLTALPGPVTPWTPTADTRALAFLLPAASMPPSPVENAGPAFVLAQPQADGSWALWRDGAGKIRVIDAPSPTHINAVVPATMRVEAAPDPAALDRSTWHQGLLAPWTPADDREPPWEVRPIGKQVWALTRYTAQGEWEFWANGTGRPVAFSAREAAQVLRMVPQGVPAVVGRSDPQLPSTETFAELWTLQRTHQQTIPYAPAVDQWLQAEQALGRTLRTAWTDPAFRPAGQPIVQAMLAIHQCVLPDDGICTDSTQRLTLAYDQLATQVAALPASPVRDTLTQQARFWRYTAGPLMEDALGLFQYDRIATQHTVDFNVEHAPRMESTGDWVARRMPSGGFLLGRLTENGTLGKVDLPIYASEDAVRVRVADQGGTLTFQNPLESVLRTSGTRPVVRSALTTRWYQAATKAFGEDAATAKLWQLMTPAPALREARLAAAQETAPTPVRPAVPPPARHLYVTPLGANRAVVWQVPTDATRKDLEPELVTWDRGTLRGLNKHRHEWLPPRRPDEPPRQWAELPAARKPWVVELEGPVFLSDVLQHVQAQVPGATVEADLSARSAPLIRALAERYGLKPTPLQPREKLWMIHPTPDGHVMVSAREWVAQEKPQYPGEYEVYLAARPFAKRAPQASEPPEVVRFPSAAAAQDFLQREKMTATVQSSMPPEIADWFARRRPGSLTPPAVRWGPQDPLRALTRADRLVQEAFAHDMEVGLRAAKVPQAARKMAHQFFAGTVQGLPQDTWDAVLPDAPIKTGVTWQETATRVHNAAQLWLAERPRLAEKLTRAPRPSQPSVSLA